MTRGHSSDRMRLALTALLALGAVGVALYTQHYLDMQPCPWCIVQRMLFCLVGFVALLGALWPLRYAREVHVATTLVAVVACVFGAASALWQQVYAAKSSSCLTTTADLIIAFTRLDSWWPEVFQARASCADASLPLLGLPYPLWSLALFLILAVASFKMHIDQRHRVVIKDSVFGNAT